MNKSSQQEPKGKLKKLILWVFATYIVLNLLLFIPKEVPQIRLDRIHPSLPVISLEAVRLDNLPFIRDVVQGIKSRISTHVSSLNPEIPGSSIVLTSTPAPPQMDSSILSTSPASTLVPTITLSPVPPSPTSTVPFSKVYYVALIGDDSNPGTESQPWRTIQKAADIAVAGDLVMVLPGEYKERVHITTSGATGAPITFQAQGVTMKGFTISADHIIINGFDITDTDNDWREGWGIFVEGSQCVLENNYVYFATRGGIILYANDGDDPITSNCRVENNHLRHNSQVGIEVQGRDHLIVGNEIWETIQYHPKWTNPPGWVDADGIRFFGSGHTIQKNYIHDISLEDTENIDPHIDCFQTWGNGAGQGIIFEQNYCVNLNVGMYGFMLSNAKNLIIRNNIIQAFGGLNTGGGGNKGLTIVNNIFANNLTIPSDRYPVGIGLTNCPETIIKNNIFYDIPGPSISIDETSKVGLDIGYNCTYHSDGSDPEGSPYPGDLWQVDPEFISIASDDFHLRSNSPMIDAGISLAVVTDDFDGNFRPQGEGYDIGAYEHPVR